MLEEPAVLVVTGAMAAGKCTVAEALARRVPLAAHVPGDAFRRMIVSGQAEMTAPLSHQVLAQLHLRQRLAAQVADGYAHAGITAGLWIDTSALTVEQTVDAIVADTGAALIELPGTRRA